MPLTHRPLVHTKHRTENEHRRKHGLVEIGKDSMRASRVLNINIRFNHTATRLQAPFRFPLNPHCKADIINHSFSWPNDEQLIPWHLQCTSNITTACTCGRSWGAWAASHITIFMFPLHWLDLSRPGKSQKSLGSCFQPCPPILSAWSASTLRQKRVVTSILF